MPYSTNVIKLLEKVEPSLREVLIAMLEEIERQREESITRSEFREFAEQTRENFNKVWESIKSLTEAQKRTEQRVNELTESQRSAEDRLTRLEEAVAELTEAQRRTEERVNELAEAQKRTEQRVNELAEAQKRTEEELKTLVRQYSKTKEIVAGISDTVGYALEDKIFPYIEDFAKKEYGVKVEVLDRRNILYPDGNFDEVNIYVEGKKNGKKVYLLGECKARPSKKEIRKFAEVLERVRNYLSGDVIGFVVGYYYSPPVEDYLRQNYPEIKAMKSFEFELRYKRAT